MSKIAEIKLGKVRTTEIRALKTREKGRWNKADIFWML